MKYRDALLRFVCDQPHNTCTTGTLKSHSIIHCSHRTKIAFEGLCLCNRDVDFRNKNRWIVLV